MPEEEFKEELLKDIGAVNEKPKTLKILTVDD
jgi:hypothetical protein